uniref:Midnolin n=1 Tax=Tetraodon nigroviridis TaxID=99883 RepID=H3CE90_TETNG
MDQHPSARSCTSRGASSCEAVPTEPSMNLYIHSTTGTRFELSLPQEETVEGLKKRLSQKLKVPKERLALLHKETRLSSGKLQDLGISDGSKLTLVPTVEAGLMAQSSRSPQPLPHSCKQASVTEVNDFLSGRSPLTLSLLIIDTITIILLTCLCWPHLQHIHLITLFNTYSTSFHPTCFRSFPLPSAHHQPLPPMYHQLPSSTHCGSPTPPPPPPHSPRPSHVPGSLFRSPAHHQHHLYQPSTNQTSHDVGQASPIAPVICPEANCSTNSASSSSGTSPSTRSRKPGAIIESFVNHAPGVFSGTFSGTLHPNCQDSNGRPRRDISTILQILNDLLSATRHYQGMPPSLTQLRCQTQCASVTGLSAEATSVPAGSPSSALPALHPLVQCQSQIRMCKSPGDHMRQNENRATRCKVERLQLLMQQKRLRRKARRDQRAPYQWLPNRKAGRSNSNSSMSSEGSLDLDFDDSVWKPDVKADLKSEFVMA